MYIENSTILWISKITGKQIQSRLANTHRPPNSWVSVFALSPLTQKENTYRNVPAAALAPRLAWRRGGRALAILIGQNGARLSTSTQSPWPLAPEVTLHPEQCLSGREQSAQLAFPTRPSPQWLRITAHGEHEAKSGWPEPQASPIRISGKVTG